MTILRTLVQTPFAGALGLAIIHSLWQGAAIALVLAIAFSLARSPRVRYACACAAILAILSGFAATLMYFLPRGAAPVSGTVRIHLPLVQGAAGQVSAASLRAGIAAILPWLSPVWLTGVVLFHLYSLAGWAAARRLRFRGVCSGSGPWTARLDELRAQIRLRRTVMLIESSLARVPATIGYLRPAILMPIAMIASMPAGQIEAILLHELAHIRRRDYLVNLLQTVVEGFLFYHPAVWWISGAIRAERENCCDDFVVATSGNRLDYAAALASLEQHREIGIQAALAATGGNLVKRIRRLLNPRENSRALLTPLLSAAVLCFGAAMAVMAFQARQPESPSWRKWVNEDVAYIVTDEERAAFNQLSTDAEYEQFVQQFWLRRDPTPGTIENEFKEEHYRRIAYANEHFSGGIPGWKTDRGRTYIVYGPPDEIDAHPYGGVYNRPDSEGGGQTTTYPFQVWRYRFIEGIGTGVKIEFVDTAGTGEYRMTRDPNEKDAILNPSRK